MNKKMSAEMKKSYQSYVKHYNVLKAKGYIMDKKLSLYGSNGYKNIWQNAKDMGLKGIGKAIAEDMTLVNRKAQRSLQKIARESGEFDYLFKKDGTFNKSAFKRNFMSGDFVAALVDMGIMTGAQFEAAYYG